MDATNLLSQQDIDDLLADHSPATQLSVVGKLTQQYTEEGDGALSAKEADIAHGIFDLLMKNAVTEVRAAMAMNLSRSSKLPVEVVRKMVADVSDVSGPVLTHSPLLSDDELMRIISEDGDVSKLEAIARRETINEAVSDALVETRVESVVKAVVLNEGAQISTATFEKITDRHSDSVEVMGSLFQRSSLPPVVVQKVMESISESMRASLEEKFGSLVEREELDKMLDQSLELTSLKMLGFHSGNRELMMVLEHLDSTNKLTPFSALSMANMQLFEVSLSRLLRVPLKNVSLLLKDPNGLRRAYEAAQLPEFLFAAAELAVRALQNLEAESKTTAGVFKDAVTPFQLMQEMRQLSGEEEVDGVEYLYALMQQSARKQLNVK